MKIVDFGFVTAEVTEKAVKHLRIVVQEDGTVRITVPFYVSEATVSKFVSERKDWILNAVNKMKGRADSEFPKFTDDTIFLWGKVCPVAYFDRRDIDAETNGNVIVISYPFESEHREKDVRLAVENLYYREMKRRVGERFPFWENEIGLKASSVSIRRMTSRYGSCTHETRRIRLAVNLAKHPPECLDYIIVHELGHILYPNHGKEFYQYLDLFYPEWKRVNLILNGR